MGMLLYWRWRYFRPFLKRLFLAGWVGLYWVEYYTSFLLCWYILFFSPACFSECLPLLIYILQAGWACEGRWGGGMIWIDWVCSFGFLVFGSHGLVTFFDLLWVYTGGLLYFALPIHWLLLRNDWMNSRFWLCCGLAAMYWWFSLVSKIQYYII